MQPASRTCGSASAQSPQDFRLEFFRSLLADGLIRAGRHEEALDEAHTACRRDAGFFLPRIIAAWSLLKLRRLDEARAMLGEARRIRPSLNRREIEHYFGRRAAAELERGLELMRGDYVCFSSLRMPSSPVTQSRAERHQICRFGIS